MIFVGGHVWFPAETQAALREAAVVAGFDPDRCAAIRDHEDELLVVGCMSDFRVVHDRNGEFSVWRVSAEMMHAILSRSRVGTTRDPAA